MDKFNAGIRFNDKVVKYIFFEFDADDGTCTVNVETNDHGALMHMSATIDPEMWEFEEDTGDGPGED